MRYRMLLPVAVAAVAVAAALAGPGPLTPAAESARAGELSLGPRLEITHAGTSHEMHLSGVAVAAARDGSPRLAWAAEEGPANQLYVARPGAGGSKPVRVNPDGLSIEALHHPPRLVVAPAGEIYLSWSSAKPKPEGTLFASDLRLSRSLDGGQSFSGHLRVNEDRPISHSFDGLAVSGDGTVLVSWLDSREGGANAGTYMARVVEGGTRVQSVTKVGDDTCVCCRLDAATGPGEAVALIWRKVFPGDIRDMVLSTSRDGGRSFGAPTLVSADHWRITACPHRGGTVGIDGRGRIYATWYTEGTQARPDLYFAASDDGRRFGPRAPSPHVDRLDSRPRAHGRRSRRARGGGVGGLDGGAAAHPLPLHCRRRTDLQRHPDAVHGHQGVGARHRRRPRRELPHRLARGAVPEREDGGPDRPRRRARRAVTPGATGSRSAAWPRCASP